MKNPFIKQQKDVSKVFKPKVDYDPKDDVLYITWLPQVKCKYSLETTNGFVFDINELENVKGIEIFDFKRRFIEKSNDREWNKKYKKIKVNVKFKRKDGSFLTLPATKVEARKKKPTKLDYWVNKKITKPTKVNFRKGGELISYASQKPKKWTKSKK